MAYKEAIRSNIADLNEAISGISLPTRFKDLVIQHGLIGDDTAAEGVLTQIGVSDYDKVRQLVEMICTKIDISSKENATKLFENFLHILRTDLGLSDLADRVECCYDDLKRSQPNCALLYSELPPQAIPPDCMKHLEKHSNCSPVPATQSHVLLPDVSPVINTEQACTYCSTVSSSHQIKEDRPVIRQAQDSKDRDSDILSINSDILSINSGILSIEDVQQLGTTSSRQGIVLDEWKVPRAKILDYMFQHQKTSLKRKAHISIGSGKIKRSLNFVLHLYPEGLKDDKGIYSTLLVCITGISHVGEGLSLKFLSRVVDTQTQDLISIRNLLIDLSQKSHTINQFLSHEIIKQSSAKHFKFMLEFQLLMPICREWIVVDFC